MIEKSETFSSRVYLRDCLSRDESCVPKYRKEEPFSFALLGLFYLTKALQTKYLSHEHHNELDVPACLAPSVSLSVFSV